MSKLLSEKFRAITIGKESDSHNPRNYLKCRSRVSEVVSYAVMTLSLME